MTGFGERILVLVAASCLGCTAPPAETDAGPREVDAMLSGPCLVPDTPGTLGDPCRCTTDCAEPWLCAPEAATGVPGGHCGRPCVSSADCGAGVCTSEGAEGFCRAACDAAGRCARPAFCGNSIRACVLRCGADGDCESGRCDRWSGDCLQPGDEPTGLLDDETCAQDTDCRSGVCGPEMACISVCSPERQGCPDGELCVQAESTTVDIGFCQQICTDTSECRGRARACLSVRGMPGVRVCQ